MDTSSDMSSCPKQTRTRTQDFLGIQKRTMDQVMSSDTDTGSDTHLSEYLGRGFGLGHDVGHDFGHG